MIDADAIAAQLAEAKAYLLERDDRRFAVRHLAGLLNRIRKAAASGDTLAILREAAALPPPDLDIEAWTKDLAR